MKNLTKAERTAHEFRVAEFMREARATNPKRVSLIESKYPVLTDRQMRRRQDAESTIGLFPLVTNAQGVYVGRLVRAYSRRAMENRRNPHPAD